MWNNVSCNPSFEKFLRRKELKRSKKSLTEIGPLIKIASPKRSLNSTLKSKKTRIKIETLQTIENSNQILLQKMLTINKSPSSLNKRKVMPRNSSAGTLNLKVRIDSQNKIMMENKRMLERLQSTQSFYSAEKWEIDYQYHKWVKNAHLKSFSKYEKKSNPLIDDKSYYDKLGISHVNPTDFYEVRSNFYHNYKWI